MKILSILLLLAHFFGFAMAVGAATAKTVLLLATRRDPGRIPAFLSASAPLTRLIVTGMILLVVSGVTWLLLGQFPLSARLLVKIALVAAVFATGPVIDKVVEPRFRKAAPGPGEPVSLEFVRARSQFLRLELAATGLFYVITILWVAR